MKFQVKVLAVMAVLAISGTSAMAQTAGQSEPDCSAQFNGSGVESEHVASIKASSSTDAESAKEAAPAKK